MFRIKIGRQHTINIPSAFNIFCLHKLTTYAIIYNASGGIFYRQVRQKTSLHGRAQTAATEALDEGRGCPAKNKM